MARSRRTTLLLWPKLDEISGDIQEDVSDCVYAITLAKGSPVRQAGMSRHSLLSELNDLAAVTLVKLKRLARAAVVRSVVVTDLSYIGGRMKLSLRIGVTGRIDEDLTIVL